MLRAMSGAAAPVELVQNPDAVWLDLNQASPEECDAVTRATGLRVPSRAEIIEIETSSRLVKEQGVLYLTTPMPSRSPDGTLTAEPIGFVVAPDRLLTVRYAPSPVFDGFADHWRCEQTPGTLSGLVPFLGLLEALVDRLADVLEQIGTETDTLSATVFAQGADTNGSARRRDRFLRATLSEIGQRGTRVSQLRDGLLGIGRIARFVPETALDWLDDAARRRLVTLERDVASLNDYDSQLTGKMQFLLDATLGFISIEQNNTIKVLTVVSIVGIPPTFVASFYGMNFHDMPELNWTYGYPYAIGLIVLSIVAPLLLFWRRGWL